MVDEAGNQLGVMTLFDAMKAAREAGLDVVEISPNAVPPVCKLVDYGKFQYELSKKAHEAKKHQKSSHIKEVKFRPSTAEHDFQVRKNQIIRFLGEGHKVKAMIFHRGREMAHQDVGRAKMERLLKEITDHALVEFGPRMEANILLALLAPKKGGARGAGAAGVIRERAVLRFSDRRGNCEEEQENEVEDASRRGQALQDDFHRENHALAFGQASPARAPRSRGACANSSTRLR